MVEASQSTGRCIYLTESGIQCGMDVVESDWKAEWKFCRQHSMAYDLASYSSITEHLRQDVREFWQRSAFFLIIEAALLTVATALDDSSAASIGPPASVLGFIGLVVAIVWTWVAVWSVVWISKWHSNVIHLEKSIDRHRSFHVARKNIWGSVQSAAVLVPIAIAVGWIVLLRSWGN